MRRAVAGLIRNGHAEAYRYSWSFFLDAIKEISGEPDERDLSDQDEWLRKMGVLNEQ